MQINTIGPYGASLPLQEAYDITTECKKHFPQFGDNNIKINNDY